MSIETSQKDTNKDGHCSRTRVTHVSHCSIAVKRHQDGGKLLEEKAFDLRACVEFLRVSPLSSWKGSMAACRKMLEKWMRTTF